MRGRTYEEIAFGEPDVDALPGGALLKLLLNFGDALLDDGDCSRSRQFRILHEELGSGDLLESSSIGVSSGSKPPDTLEAVDGAAERSDP